MKEKPFSQHLKKSLKNALDSFVELGIIVIPYSASTMIGLFLSSKFSNIWILWAFMIIGFVLMLIWDSYRVWKRRS